MVHLPFAFVKFSSRNLHWRRDKNRDSPFVCQGTVIHQAVVQVCKQIPERSRFCHNLDGVVLAYIDVNTQILREFFLAPALIYRRSSEAGNHHMGNLAVILRECSSGEAAKMVPLWAVTIALAMDRPMP